MAYETILLDIEDGVGIVTLNRPDKLNAMNRMLGRELHDAVKKLEADDSIGCIVITGSGDRAFSAGGDIHEQREDDHRYTEEQLETMRDSRRSYDISACAKPVIGMMNGLAYGGAAVLASSLDMRVGCEATRFRFLAAARSGGGAGAQQGCAQGDGRDGRDHQETGEVRRSEPGAYRRQHPGEPGTAAGRRR